MDRTWRAVKPNRRIYLYVGFAIALITISAVTLLAIKTLRDRDLADQWVMHSQTVITMTYQAQLGVVNMESGLRGYLLTGNKIFLTSYQEGKSQYRLAIQNLITATQDNPEQVQLWQSVQRQVDQWDQRYGSEGMQIREKVEEGALPDQAARDYALSLTSKVYMDSIRGELEQGKQIEADLLAERQEAEKNAKDVAVNMTVFGTVFSVVLALLAGLLLTRVSIVDAQKLEVNHLLIQEREKERMQIARDLHDGPVQELIAISYSLQGLMMDEITPQQQEQVEGIRAAVQGQISELRGYAMALRPPVLARFGLEKAIRSHLEQFRSKHPDINVLFEAHQVGDILPEDCRLVMFRIYQETMNNITRHSQANEVRIKFNKTEETAVLEIGDNGIGFTMPTDWVTLARHGHLGLVGIRERAEAAGGRVEILSQPGKGTIMRVAIPLPTQ
jgi:signal transduction histidine kinase